MTNKASGEELVVLTTGQVLFQQGEKGGDLFFIQSGEIEIYRESGGQDLVLTKMGEGEVIGIMTCMTSEPRMASARATIDAVVKKVKHENINKLMGKLPHWMNVVLKDFTIRLNQMNKSYSDSMIQIKDLQANQVSKIYTATQLASAISSTADFIKIQIDDVEAVIVEDMLEFLEQVLRRPKDELADIFAIFLESGIVKVQIEQDKKRTYTTVANCKSLTNFCSWVEASGRGEIRKLLKMPITHKEHRVLNGLVKYSNKMQLNLKGTVYLPVKDLNKTMEKLVGQKFEVEALNQAQKVKLVAIEGEEEDMKVSFVPIKLSRTLAHLVAYKKLQKLEEVYLRRKQQKQGIAA